jgi:chromosome segregation ATPase|tara:strand:- start:254 stop:529 length:276 start_codon:yes stop_codon:yes gene_type:complete
MATETTTTDGTIKFSEEELGQLKTLRTRYADISHELGQLHLNQHAINKRKSTLENDVDAIQSSERILADELKTKYGEGSIDIDTGVFIPSK